MTELTLSKNLILQAYEALDDKIGQDIKIIDIHNISVLADYFIIAHGNNKPHIHALIDAVEDKLIESGYKPIHKEGYNTASWVLLDYGNIIVHVFNKNDRLFYDLERIWIDGKEITIDEMKKESAMI